MDSNIRKLYYSWEEYKWAINNIHNRIINDYIPFKPQYIIGISRGGIVPAISLSYKLDTPVFFHDPKKDSLSTLPINFAKDKILFVDDINDTGFTVKSIRKRVIKLLHPEINVIDEKIFNLDNIKFIVVFENKSSCITTHYHYEIIDKSKEDIWVVFPWEI